MHQQTNKQTLTIINKSVIPCCPGRAYCTGTGTGAMCCPGIGDTTYCTGLGVCVVDCGRTYCTGTGIMFVGTGVAVTEKKRNIHTCSTIVIYMYSCGHSCLTKWSNNK